MARTPNIAKVKKTLKDTASVTQETVGQVVGKARDTVESISPVGLPKRGSASRKKAKASAPERLEPQGAPRKTHGDALKAGSGSAPPIATKKATAKKAPAKKAPSKEATAKKTAAKKTTAKKTAAKKAPSKKSTAKKTAAKKTPAKKSTAKKTAAKK